MGKVLLILLVSFTIFAVNEAAFRYRRQSVDGVDPNKIPALLNNQAYVDQQRKCLLADDREASTICDKVGKKLREILVPSIKKGDCASSCTSQEKEALAQVIITVKKKYPALWKEVCDHYKISQEEGDQSEKWANGVLSKKT
ncbi:hypothetical protein CHUAL_008241 [Chamberlinius hualienensis]